jgi:hypothetical protein
MSNAIAFIVGLIVGWVGFPYSGEPNTHIFTAFGVAVIVRWCWMLLKGIVHYRQEKSEFIHH